MIGATKTNRKTICHDRRNESGSSLIGVCLLIISLGAIITGGLALYKNYDLVTSDQETVNKNLMITKAINDFVFRNNRYPCAAPLNARRDSEFYGREERDILGNIVPCNDPNYYAGSQAPSPGNPITAANAGGIYISQGHVRPAVPEDLAAIPPIPFRPALPTGNIIIGALPTRDLNLPDDMMYDGYGKRFIYAVTANMAIPGIDITQDLGGITIEDEGQESLSDVAGHVIYSFFSPGIDPRGAFSRDGVLIADCVPPAGPTDAVAGMNCDNDGNSVFLAALRKRY